jgi:uncharacterized protein (DUF302 family)
MSYHISKVVNLSFEEAENRIREELKNVGFGILTEINVKKTLKERINEEFRDYKILGACNPKIAHKALLSDDKLGVMLPCSVVIQKHQNGDVEISIMNPVPFINLTNNENVTKFANDIEFLLNSAMERI